MYYALGAESGGTNTYELAGLSGLYLNYSLDGVEAKQTPRSAVGDVNNSAMPAVDALAEAHVWATGIPAELGHSAGGAENMVTKSGTNQVHWTAEERYINKDWIHHELFQDGPLTTPFEYHNFDTTLGFPIYIPHIYDGRNKSFLFLAERFDYDHETDEQVASVPSLNMLGKDPSNPGPYEFNWASNAQPIYDPATYACVGGTGPTCTGGTWTGAQFGSPAQTGVVGGATTCTIGTPGCNVIPANRIDPVAKAFLALNPYQAPTNTNTNVTTGPSNNLNANNNYLADKEGLMFRFDQVLGAKDKLYVRWLTNQYHNVPGRQSIVYNPAEDYLLDATSASYARPEPFNTNNGIFAETHVFSSSLINEFRYGYMRRSDNLTVFSENQGWAGKLGMPGVPGSTFPLWNSTSNSNASWSAGPGANWLIIQDDFDISDDITKTKGHHVFKWGWQGLRMRENDSGTESNAATSEPLPSGLYTFSGLSTEKPNGSSGTPNTGNSFASFILGAPDYAVYSEQLEKYEPRWWSNEFYFEDSWQLTSKLTLNLGIRYDFESASNTRGGYKSEFSPTATDPVTGDEGAITNPTGSIYPNSGNNWAPRIGVAYNFSPKWVFRGAFDLFTVDNMEEMGMDNYEAQFAVASPVGSPLPGMYLSNGPGAINYPINTSTNTASYVSATNNFSSRTATYLDPGLHNGRTMSYTAGVQYQLWNNTMIEVDYIGSAGIGLVDQNAVNINVLPQSIYNGSFATPQSTVFSSQQSYLPFPQFGSINYYKNWDGSVFNSGTVDFQRRLSKGITWDFHYTYEKTIDNGPGVASVGSPAYIVGTGEELNVVGGNNPKIVSGSNPLTISYNHPATRVEDSGSFKHQFTGTTTWLVPVGRGRKYLNSSNAFVDGIVGGWRILTIQNVRTGSVVAFTQNGNPNHELTGQGIFMNLVPGTPIKTPHFALNKHNMWPEANQNPYYQIAAFAYPAAFTPGTSGTDASTLGPIWWPQYSVAKTVTYKERYKLTARLDADMLFPEYSPMQSISTAANVTSPTNFGKTSSQSYGFSAFGSLNGTYIGSLRLEF